MSIIALLESNIDSIYWENSMLNQNTESWGIFTNSSLCENTEISAWTNLLNDLAINHLDLNKECPICLCNLHDSNLLLVSCSDCKNIFHEECQKTWLTYNTHKNCSMCRSRV